MLLLVNPVITLAASFPSEEGVSLGRHAADLARSAWFHYTGLENRQWPSRSLVRSNPTPWATPNRRESASAYPRSTLTQ